MYLTRLEFVPASIARLNLEEDEIAKPASGWNLNDVDFNLNLEPHQTPVLLMADCSV